MPSGSPSIARVVQTGRTTAVVALVLVGALLAGSSAVAAAGTPTASFAGGTNGVLVTSAAHQTVTGTT